VRIKIVLGDESYPAILAHLDHFNAASSALKHPVIILEARNNALDGTFDAERFAAAHAVERFFFLEHARRRGHGAKVNLGHQTDDFLWASCPTQPTLNAGILGEP